MIQYNITGNLARNPVEKPRGLCELKASHISQYEILVIWYDLDTKYFTLKRKEPTHIKQTHKKTPTLAGTQTNIY